MTLNKTYNGTLIGAIYTIISFALSFTILIPVFSIIPGAKIESIIASIIKYDSYSIVGKATTWTLFILFIASMAIISFIIRKTTKTNNLSNEAVFVVMAMQYFIIHALGFYLYWGIVLDYRSDGQIAFASVSSFPISSFGFIIIGLIIDLAKSKPLNRNTLPNNEQTH